MKWLSICLFLIFPSAALAQASTPVSPPDEEIFQDDDIHSDLPLYGFDEPEFWPRSSVPEGAIAGCASRVSFGDWAISPSAENEFGSARWFRFTNYGVFHCAAIIGEEYDREYLHEADTEPGFFVRIGEIDHGGSITELWVIQRGALPGSDYVLLARAPSHDLIEEFTVLQRQCPPGAMRVFEGNLDILRTDYCAINTQEDMLRLATTMLDYPPLGTMRRMGDSDWEAPEPEAAEEPEPPEPEDGSFLLDALEAERQ